jgi:hypothetical protein
MTMHDMTQTKLGRTALHVSGTYLDRPLERNNGRMEGRLWPCKVYYRE